MSVRIERRRERKRVDVVQKNRMRYLLNDTEKLRVELLKSTVGGDTLDNVAKNAIDLGTAKAAKSGHGVY